MERRHIGIVKELYRYPVKSLLGERLNQVEVSTEGVAGDRAWALIDESDGRVMSAKKFPAMLDVRADHDPELTADSTILPRITLPGGRAFFANDAAAAAALSELLHRKLRLSAIEPGQKRKAGIEPATIFGDVGVTRVFPDLDESTIPLDFKLLRGTFFDSATIHVIATGTLAHMRTLAGGDAIMDACRFRPNIVVETPPDATGFVEDGWLNGRLEMGGSLRIVSMEPALRCVMTTHAQEDLPRDLRVLRAAADHHHATVGVFASIGYPGTVRVGDPVWLVI
jgi:MOSC domain-containing protein